MALISWLGGLAFAGALAYLAYFYAIVLGEPAPHAHAPLTAGAIDAALFAAFAAHHSLFARERAKRWVRRVAPPELERSIYVWASSALLVGTCALWQPLPGVVYEAHGWWRVPFWAVQAAGVLLTVLGARVIDPLELAGIQQATGRRGRDHLEVTGPFRLVRHPIYLGWMLMVFGTPSMTASRLLFAAVSSAYLILAIPWEEKSLVAAHGDRYRAYRTAVRWRVLPGIW